MTAKDGHSYERAAVEMWFRDHSTSPKTGAALASKELLPAHALRNAIEEWQQANCKLILRSALTFRDPEDRIGVGSFKLVFKGALRLPGSPRSTTVAVLQVRSGDVAAEAAVLLRIGRHPRLVTFIGQCHAPGSDVLLLTEFAPMGSLRTVIEEVEDDITLQHKVVIIQQVVAGMEALALQKLIHRDLALRNVLVFALDMDDVTATSVKVSDFGLTVNAYTASARYVQGGALPIRYLAPESLRKGRYSEKSDVWAFGVTCWELLTNGDIPYNEITADDNVVAYVREGGTLARPPDEEYACPDPLWELMECCWASKPQDRPGFAELGISLGVMEIEPGSSELMVHVGYIEACHKLHASASTYGNTPAWKMAVSSQGFSPCGNSGGCPHYDPNLLEFKLLPKGTGSSWDDYWGGCVQDSCGRIRATVLSWFPEGREGISHKLDYGDEFTTCCFHGQDCNYCAQTSLELL